METDKFRGLKKPAAPVGKRVEGNELFEEFDVKTKKKDKKGNSIWKKIFRMTGTRVNCEVCGGTLSRKNGQIVRFCSKRCKQTLNKKGRKAKALRDYKMEQKHSREAAEYKKELRDEKV